MNLSSLSFDKQSKTPSGDFISSDYEDVLGERRGQSDLRWAAQEWQSTGTFSEGRRVSHDEAVRTVLQSQRVQQAMKKVSEAEGKSLKQLCKDVEETLHTMGHSLDISAIRKFAFTLPKIMKTICDKILVHRPGIERLRTALRHRPVVLLPTHRSYADFLLVSYLTFHFNLPFPVIAAGMDFIHMAYIGTLLREAGAFYIKRSFMEDDLYWAVFQEYVHMLVCCEEAPMEFFLEGTRSRTGKSLRPKLGLLGCVCQCCWRGHTQDVLLVPINISYSRTLEEELYAYELLGVPKPKESTSGLFKAKRILSENYGNIFVHVGEPVSVRNVVPPSVPDIAPLSPLEMSGVERLGLQLVREQQKLAVVSTFSLATHSLLRAMHLQEQPVVQYADLLTVVTALVIAITDKSAGTSCRALWEGTGIHASVDAALQASLTLHSNIVSLHENGSVHLTARLTPPRRTADTDQGGGSVKQLQASSITRGVQQLLLQHYANQSMHVLLRPALVALAIGALHQLEGGGAHHPSESVVQERFTKLCNLFGHEFIFAKNSEQEDFRDGLERLTAAGCTHQTQDGALSLHSDPSSPLHVIYTSCLDPFVLSHTTAIVVAAQQEWRGETALVTQVQQAVEETLLRGDSHHLYSALCLDSCRNAVRAIIKIGGLASVRTNGNASPSKLVPCARVLRELLSLVSGVTTDIVAEKVVMSETQAHL